MHTKEMIDEAIENKVEQLVAAPQEFNIYAEQFNFVQRLTAKRTNMRNNTRRVQILAGHNKIMQVINGRKF